MKTKTTWTIAAGCAAAVAAGAALLASDGSDPAEAPPDAPEVVVHASPTCGCCSAWAEHMRASGFEVREVPREDMQRVKAEFDVDPGVTSCHTAVVGDYLVEGHVPAGDVVRLLREKPDVAGLAVPGMPMGSPGMEGPRKDPYDVLAFDADGETRVWARR